MEKLIKIYFWQIISIALSFMSLFVVTPFLSSNQPVFGTYSIIASLVLFLSYADLGFISAGIKYASESYAQKDKDMEQKIIGFVGFIFMIFLAVYMLIIFYIAYKPNILINNLNNENTLIAGKLLLILALSAPLLFLQRILQIIFGIRLEDYLFQRTLIVSNCFKILSVFFFFRKGHYDIVNYFAFSQLCLLIAIIYGIYVAEKKYEYRFKSFFKNFKFNKNIYLKTSNLAYSSLFLTLCWVAYYDMPPLVISKLLGAKQIAIYAIGLNLINLLRALFGIIFSPFNAKFNYFVGLKDNEGLKEFFFKIIILSAPLTVFPVIAISITAKSFIYSWVGSSYFQSVTIAQMLVLSYLYSCISYPAGILIIAYERTKPLIISSAVLPIIYWLGVLFTYKYLNLTSFALFKFVAFSITAIIYIIIVLKIFNLKIAYFIKKVLLPLTIPCLVLVIISCLIKNYLFFDKGKINLIINVLIDFLVISLVTIIYYFTSRTFKTNVNSIFAMLFKSKKLSFEN